MSLLFRNILLPVDFTINTEIAVEKALGLADGRPAVIHLLHVISLSSYVSSIMPIFNFNIISFNKDLAKASKKLEEWQSAIVETRPDIAVEIHLLEGENVQRQIAEVAKKINPELIIIGKHNFHNWFPFLNTTKSGELVKQTNCPVLTVKAGSLHNKVKVIVFPVTTLVHMRKIELLVALTRRYSARVYLVTLAKESGRFASMSRNAFVDTYHILKAGINCPIEHKVIMGANLTKAALRFAGLIKADMILVSPEEDAGMFLLRRHQFTDRLKSDSRLEVLSVEPYSGYTVF